MQDASNFKLDFRFSIKAVYNLKNKYFQLYIFSSQKCSFGSISTAETAWTFLAVIIFYLLKLNNWVNSLFHL